MFRFWQSLVFVLLGLSVQFCGSGNGGGGGGGGNNIPPPDLPTYSPAEFDASVAGIDAAEKKLAEKGFRFTEQGGKVSEDRKALEVVMAEHPDQGLEDLLPGLDAYQKVLGEHLAKFGKGFYRDENGKKNWVRADQDPLRAQRAKLDIARSWIDIIKKNSLDNEGNGASNSAPDTGGSTGRAAPPPDPGNGGAPPPSRPAPAGGGLRPAPAPTPTPNGGGSHPAPATSHHP